MTRIPLLKAFRASLWSRVVDELDRTVEDLARELNAHVSERRTVDLAGRRARQYELEFEYRGRSVTELLTSIFRARSQYQLLCRWESAASRPAACDVLLQTFRLSSPS